MENNKKDIEFLKEILNNRPLLKWVKMFSADFINKDLKAENFNIKLSENSLSIEDCEKVKMFISSAEFKGKKYLSLNLSQIRETLKIFSGEGRLFISESDTNRLGYIQSGDNIIVIAPIFEED